MTRGPSKRESSNVALLKDIKKCHLMSDGTYGSHRTWDELHKSGISCSEKRVARLMKDAGICGVVRRKHRQTPLDTNAASYPDNLLARYFSAEAANLKWVTDITYIRTLEGWLYLAVVIDLHSRAVVGWSMKKSLETKIILDALTMAMWRRKPVGEVIIHSDQGSQFGSDEFNRWCKDNRLSPSMSRRGNCWDNAVAEAFFSNLKSEQIKPKNGSWMHLPALLLGCQARRDDAAGSCLQGGATPHGAPKAVLASA